MSSELECKLGKEPECEPFVNSELECKLGKEPECELD